MAPPNDAVLIDAQIITDPNVTHGLPHAFMVIALYAGDDGFVGIGMTRLGRAAGMSRRQGMGKHVDDLAALGYLRLEKRGRAQRVWVV